MQCEPEYIMKGKTYEPSRKQKKIPFYIYNTSKLILIRPKSDHCLVLSVARSLMLLRLD